MANMRLNGGRNGKEVVAINNVCGHLAFPALSRFDSLPKSAMTGHSLEVAYGLPFMERETRIILCEGFLVFRLEHEQIPLVAIVQVVSPATSVEREFGFDSRMKSISHIL